MTDRRPGEDLLCRDCLTRPAAEPRDGRCPNCRSPRLIRHPELHLLSIAHLDCDAFYASVEKRDDPSLRSQPVIIGGGRRGVVSTACYVARTFGVHSAMPMFKALKACPDAVVIKPDMDKYTVAARRIRAILQDYTPLIEPLSLDEAFLDLSGTERLHGQSPAQTLASIATRIENEVGVSASIGLSYNKFLAKVASDLDKPRGFAVIGEADAREFLSRQPVSILWGVGKQLQHKLAKDGITRIDQLQAMEQKTLVQRYGSMGLRMSNFVHGRDGRRVTTDAPLKTVSSETTFERDISEFAALDAILWRQAERVARRLKKADRGGQTVVLKLKSADFRVRTRNRKLAQPTQLAETIYRTASPLLRKEVDGTAYRLLGVGVNGIVPGADCDPLDLGDPRRRASGQGRAGDGQPAGEVRRRRHPQGTRSQSVSVARPGRYSVQAGSGSGSN